MSWLCHDGQHVGGSLSAPRGGLPLSAIAAALQGPGGWQPCTAQTGRPSARIPTPSMPVTVLAAAARRAAGKHSRGAPGRHRRPAAAARGTPKCNRYPASQAAHPGHAPSPGPAPRRPLTAVVGMRAGWRTSCSPRVPRGDRRSRAEPAAALALRRLRRPRSRAFRRCPPARVTTLGVPPISARSSWRHNADRHLLRPRPLAVYVFTRRDRIRMRYCGPPGWTRVSEVW